LSENRERLMMALLKVIVEARLAGWELRFSQTSTGAIHVELSPPPELRAEDQSQTAGSSD